MKRERTDIKKTIKKRIELRHNRLAFIEKKNVMNERDRKRIEPSKFAPVRVELVSRNDRRSGNYDTSSTIEYLPILENKEPVSIIITAYKTKDYIEECLDSIENQTYFINNDNYEILVGIDGCQETLDKLLEIRHKYRNLRIFMMKSNMGTYVTSNTLLKLINNENIIRFDSDDIMRPEMVNEIFSISGDFNMIRMRCKDVIISSTGEKKFTNFQRHAAGVIFYKRTIFNVLGGYRSWVCAADSELIERYKTIGTIGYIDKILFYRRVHGNSLSKKEETSINSTIRRGYHNKIREFKNSKNKILFVRRKTNRFTEIL